MGYIRHHAIVVTSESPERIIAAHVQATALGCDVSNIVGSVMNYYESFLVAPDGSKEGWENSDLGDARRDQFVAWLRGQCYEDGSSPFAWAEVRYGDDESVASLTRASDAKLTTGEAE